jgi:hypothetical protein
LLLGTQGSHGAERGAGTRASPPRAAAARIAVRWVPPPPGRAEKRRSRQHPGEVEDRGEWGGGEWGGDEGRGGEGRWIASTPSAHSASSC